MKTTEFKLGPKTLYLYFNGEAMFQLNELDKDQPENAPDWISRMLENTLEGKRLLCKAAHILATQGELCRRYLQYDPERVPTEEDLQLLVTPMAIVGLRSAVMAAIDDGFSAKSQDDDGDIDVGLAELEKKTKPLRSRLI